MEPIFAGKLSLTDDIPDEPPASATPLGWREKLLTIEQARAQLNEMQANRIEGVPLKPATLTASYGQMPDRRFQTPAEQMQGTWNYVKDTYGQPQPLPEPGLSSAAQRVRAEAARLGIDYDAEVAKVLNRLRSFGLTVIAPNPWNKKAGPDPVGDDAMRQAERATAEILKREHGMEITWEE